MVRPSVLHVVTSDERRGAERVAEELAGALSRRGWRSELVALAHRPPGGLEVTVLGQRARGPAALVRLRRLARQYDVVVAHGSSTLDAAAVGLAATRTPFVYVGIGDPRHWLTSSRKRARVRWALSRAAAVVAIADPAARVLVDWVGVAPDSVSVIRNGRDAERFAPADPVARAAARAALGLEEASPVALVLGALSEEKRVDVALRAAAAVPGLQVLLAGDGPLRAELEALAECELPGRARFLGSVADPLPALAAADLVLLTSRTEGVPGALVEAGLAGLPAVASDVGFVSDVVRDGVTGRLVPPGDVAATAQALREVLERAGELGAAAREHCRVQHDADDLVEQWERLLQDVHERPDIPSQRRVGI